MTARESVKAIADEARMIVVYQLADLIVKIVPKNKEGNAWVEALYTVSKWQLRERGVVTK
jgi:hypothetical protein